MNSEFFALPDWGRRRVLEAQSMAELARDELARERELRKRAEAERDRALHKLHKVAAGRPLCGNCKRILQR